MPLGGTEAVQLLPSKSSDDYRATSPADCQATRGASQKNSRHSRAACSRAQRQPVTSEALPMTDSPTWSPARSRCPTPSVPLVCPDGQHQQRDVKRGPCRAPSVAARWEVPEAPNQHTLPIRPGVARSNRSNAYNRARAPSPIGHDDHDLFSDVSSIDYQRPQRRKNSDHGFDDCVGPKHCDSRASINSSSHEACADFGGEHFHH